MSVKSPSSLYLSSKFIVIYVTILVFVVGTCTFCILCMYRWYRSTLRQVEEINTSAKSRFKRVADTSDEANTPNLDFQIEQNKLKIQNELANTPTICDISASSSSSSSSENLCLSTSFPDQNPKQTELMIPIHDSSTNSKSKTENEDDKHSNATNYSADGDVSNTTIFDNKDLSNPAMFNYCSLYYQQMQYIQHLQQMYHTPFHQPCVDTTNNQGLDFSQIQALVENAYLMGQRSSLHAAPPANLFSNLNMRMLPNKNLQCLPENNPVVNLKEQDIARELSLESEESDANLKKVMR